MADVIIDAVSCQAGVCGALTANVGSEILGGSPLVALLLEPSPEFAVTVLACLKAG